MLKNRKIPLNLKRDFKTGEKRGDYEKTAHIVRIKKETVL